MRPSGRRGPASAALTVAIPLHRAEPWLDVVSANVANVPDDARIVLSDRTGCDDALAELLRRHGDDPRVELRQGDGGPGWREHVNERIAACRTPLFSILPQDDSIAPGYFERLVAALRGRRSAGLAFGTVRTRGLHASETDLPGPPFPLGRQSAWRDALALDRQWNLGIPWRGVVRRRHLRPIRATPGDRFADQIWVFGIALEAHLVEVPEAVYLKRYHRGNTHGAWTPLAGEERRAAKAAEIRRRLARRPLARARALALLG